MPNSASNSASRSTPSTRSSTTHSSKTHSSKTQPRVLSGIQPTGESFHFGNYFGALRQWVELQQDFDAFYFIADLHAITVPYEADMLAERTLASAAQLIAAGVDPQQSTLFLQSHVPEHAQLAWVLNCIAGFGEASRMTQFKDKSAREGTESASVGLFTYPVLMAADILIYQCDRVPVGEDQRQHLELTRNLAQRFNHRFGDTFTVPEPHIIREVAKITDLQEPTAKMSKSASSPNGIIELLDTPKKAAKKIRSAVTDSGSQIAFDPETKPGISNLLTIYSALTGQSVESIQDEYAGSGYGAFKVALSELAADLVDDFGRRTRELLDDRGELERILADGAERARDVAAQTLRSVYERSGFVTSR